MNVIVFDGFVFELDVGIKFIQDEFKKIVVEKVVV